MIQIIILYKHKVILERNRQKDYNLGDIAPTLATLLEVEFPNGNTGKVIEGALSN